MKAKILILTLVIAALGAPCFASAVHVTADLTADFATGASAQQIISTFTDGSQPALGGFGWEAILGRMGFGGDYEVDFHKDAAAAWWLDWYAPALYLSLHPVGANHFLDPFIQVGFGCAGRVFLQGMSAPDFNDQLMLSLFPFAAVGLGLNLDGLLISAKVNWTPYNIEIPVTNIPVYPLGTIQVTLTAGLSLGW